MMMMMMMMMMSGANRPKGWKQSFATMSGEKMQKKTMTRKKIVIAQRVNRLEVDELIGCSF